MKVEQNYDFRERLTVTNKKNVCTKATSDSDYITIDGVEIVCVKGEIMANAKKDFIDFLQTSAGISEPEKKGGIKIEISLDEGLEHYKERVIEVSDQGIVITAKDERGAASSLFDLEQMMVKEGARSIKKGSYRNYPYFSPRMVHSAYGLDMYPDEYLLNLSKEGIDGIIVYVKEINRDPVKEVDYDDICRRANSFGIDVYAYCLLRNFNHPNAEGAKQIYSDIYGKLFREHNGLKGIIFVGESVEFPSEDENVAKRHWWDEPEDGIPDGRTTPGWWPCKDYPEWISLIRDCVREERPDADIIFWTYNWGYVNKEARIKLINSLPTDISLMVTFEMFQRYSAFGVTEMIHDYSIIKPGAGEYFLSEAEVAKKRGIRLYSMTNTGGRTWDFGVVPYVPTLHLWQQRFDNVVDCREKYGLCGLVESHHYGCMPSFISKLAKYCFEYGGDLVGGKNSDDYTLSVIKEFFGDQTDTLVKGLKKVSESFNYYMATNELQNGPIRIGPAYPLCLRKIFKHKDRPDVYYGLRICDTEYHAEDTLRGCSLHSVRNPRERKALIKCLALVEEGRKILETVTDKTEDLERLINILAFIERCLSTSICVKEFFILRHKLYIADSKKKVAKIVKRIKQIAEEEIKNTELTIPIVEKDSSLGYEPSMEYQCDKEHLLWKIKQVRYMIDVELAVIEFGLKY